MNELFLELSSQLETSLKKAREKSDVDDEVWAQVSVAARDTRDSLAAMAASFFRNDVDLQKAKSTLEQVRRCLDNGHGAEDCCRNASGQDECAVAAKALVSSSHRVKQLLPKKEADRLLRDVLDGKVMTAWLRLAKRISLGIGASVLVLAVATKLKDFRDAAHDDTHIAAARSLEAEKAKAQDAVVETRDALDMPAAALQLAAVAADAAQHGPSPLAEQVAHPGSAVEDLFATKLLA